MGPKQSSPSEQTPSIKINHPVFAISRLIRNKEEQQEILAQVRLASNKQFTTWATRLDEMEPNDNLMLPIKKQYKSEGLCGTSGVAYLTYENFPYLLSDEISNRQGMERKLFQENQLWYLVYTLLSAALTYHKKGSKLGDLRPENIFINEDGQVRVASIDSWPGEQTNVTKSFYEKQITYLAPQEIKDYQHGKTEASDKQLADTFSIGLTSLDAATLSQSKSLYSKNFKFNYQKLQNRLKQFKEYGYSELLTFTIQNMCEIDTAYRSSSRQIYQWLLPHEQEIVNLEDFQVNDLPQKMKLAKQRTFGSTLSHQGLNASSTLQPNQTIISGLKYPIPNFQPSSFQPSSFQPSSFQPSSFQPSSFQPSSFQPSPYQASTYQPISYQASSFQPIPTYTPSNYQSPLTIPQQSIQTSYQFSDQQVFRSPVQVQVHQGQPIQHAQPVQTNSSSSNIYYNQVNSSSENYSFKNQTNLSALEKIDQQLQQSRKLFPS